MSEGIKEFTIDRSKWLQGGYLKWMQAEGEFVESQLRDSRGMMCCLGFYSKACGAKGLTGKSTPDELDPTQIKKLDERLFQVREYEPLFGGKPQSLPVNSPLTDKLMDINDDKTTSDTVRERCVTERFARLGVRVKFTGEYPYAK